MREKEITLTEQELQEIKDVICFREKVLLQLKRLNGVPTRVTKLETKVVVLMWGIPILVGIVGILLGSLR